AATATSSVRTAAAGDFAADESMRPSSNLRKPSPVIPSNLTARAPHVNDRARTERHTDVPNSARDELTRSRMPLAGPSLGEPVQVPTLLARGLASNPDDPALSSAETSLSWRELETLSTRLAANLLGLGLRPGDRVASLMPNRPALAVHYLACLKAGLVATPLNY